MKIYAVFLIILLIILQFKFWFDKGGYFYNLGLEDELATLKEQNTRLKVRNQKLARQIILVKEDRDEIEALARRNLGMVKDGEQFVFIFDHEADSNRQQKPPEQPKPDAWHHEQ